MLLTILLLGSSWIASGVLYRLGGKGKPFNTRYRDAGCSLVLIALTIALFGLKIGFWWVYLLTLGLSWGSLASYWGQDEKKWGFWAHGLGCGLAGLPLMLVMPWYWIALRLVVCAVGMAVWSEKIGNVTAEEVGRGVLFI